MFNALKNFLKSVLRFLFCKYRPPPSKKKKEPKLLNAINSYCITFGLQGVTPSKTKLNWRDNLGGYGL